MLDQFSRTRLTLGSNGVESLQKAHVIVFGCGGVGGYVCESLVRSGLGAIDIVDDDKVCLTNINRQIIATWKTVGMDKVDAMEERLLDINPSCKITKHKCFYLPDSASEFDLSKYDYIVDCVDTVTAKLHLVAQAKTAGTPIISAMGAGNKLDPTAIRIADISETSICRLARIIRKELRKRGIHNLKVAYSPEPTVKPEEDGRAGCAAGCVCRPTTSAPALTDAAFLAATPSFLRQWAWLSAPKSQKTWQDNSSRNAYTTRRRSLENSSHRPLRYPGTRNYMRHHHRTRIH